MNRLLLGFVLGVLAVSSFTLADDEPPTWTRWSGVVRHELSAPKSIHDVVIHDDGQMVFAKGVICEDVLREQAGLIRHVDGTWRRP